MRKSIKENQIYKRYTEKLYLYGWNDFIRAYFCTGSGILNSTNKIKVLVFKHNTNFSLEESYFLLFPRSDNVKQFINNGYNFDNVKQYIRSNLASLMQYYKL